MVFTLKKTIFIGFIGCLHKVLFHPEPPEQLHSVIDSQTVSNSAGGMNTTSLKDIPSVGVLMLVVQYRAMSNMSIQNLP